jgi:hypothetical protein
MLAPLALLAVATVAPITDPPDSAPTLRPRVVRDAVVIGSGTVAYSLLLNPGVRSGLRAEASLAMVLANLALPVHRAVQGAREDQDSFATNYVAHPVTWGLLGMYLKDRGYSSLGAFAFTQVHSMWWEYVIEGSYMKPSGNDLVMNFVGAGVAIYVLHGMSERAAAREDKRFYHYVLTALNPVRTIRGVFPAGVEAEVRFGPGQVGLALR